MKKTKLLIIIIALAALALANLPFLYFTFVGKEGFVFLGRHVINSEDTYTYVSFIEQAKQGRTLFENLYTTEPQVPSLLRPSYLVIGKAAAVLNISSIIAYHASKIIFSILFFVILYKFISKIFKDSNQIVLSFLVVTLANGLGSINWIPEAFTFLSLSEAPHFILSQALMVLIFYLLIMFSEEKKYKFVIFMALAGLILSLEHPFDLIIIAPVIAFSLIWSDYSPTKSFFVALAASIGLGYQYIESTRNPILSAWQSQNTLFSPSPTDYILGFGFLVPLALVGIESFLKEKSFQSKLIIIWLISVAILIYAPISFQRRLIEGANIPLSILATTGLITLSRMIKKYGFDILVLALIALPIWSVTSVIQNFPLISANQNNYYFMDKDELEAIAWLGNQTNFSDIILTNKDYGNLIPGLIGRKTYLGHAIQTINLNGKIALTNSFLLEKNDLTAYSFLSTNKITYIFLGKSDAMLRYGFRPETKKFLTKVYNKAGVTIYKVNQGI